VQGFDLRVSKNKKTAMKNGKRQKIFDLA